MTLIEISRYFHLNETIQKNREALKFLRERAEPAAPSLNGMPHASGVKDSTGRLAVEIADIKLIFQSLIAGNQKGISSLESNLSFCVI